MEHEPVYVDGNRKSTLPELFVTRGYTTGAEIGVFKGAYSAYLCKNMPGLKLYSIDPWREYRTVQVQADNMGKSKADSMYESANELLSEYDCEVIRKFSLDAAARFSDLSLDFVYIDANHEYQHVKDDIAAWEPKVRVGGVVSGHDFHIPDVIRAVKEWTQAHKTSPWYVLSGDESPSWYWIK
jgi:predicted O-methyltransferase YrrM